jgi:hypothetical protein
MHFGVCAVSALPKFVYPFHFQWANSSARLFKLMSLAVADIDLSTAKQLCPIFACLRPAVTQFQNEWESKSLLRAPGCRDFVSPSNNFPKCRVIGSRRWIDVKNATAAQPCSSPSSSSARCRSSES